MEGKWVIRTYKCKNGVVEKSKFWVPKQTRVRRGRVRGNTGAAKRDQNWRSAVKQLARILNCNFSAKDLFVRLGYDDAHLPGDHKSQDKALGNFIDRLKRAAKRAGVDPKHIKYVMVPSETDGATGRPARPHVHMVLTGEGICFRDGKWMLGEKSLDDIWGAGSTYTQQLRAQPDYTSLAVYMLRQARVGADEKKYKRSRNMAEPIITETVALTGRPLRQPAHTVMMERGEYHEETGHDYIRYWVKPKEGDTNGA